jgi:hypothetical protein
VLAAIVAVGGLVVAAATFMAGFWVASLTRKDVTVSGRDLSLTAYANVIQGGILDLKRNFAHRPEIFHRQMERNSRMKDLIPDYMRDDMPAFLACRSIGVIEAADDNASEYSSLDLPSPWNHGILEGS